MLNLNLPLPEGATEADDTVSVATRGRIPQQIRRINHNSLRSNKRISKPTWNFLIVAEIKLLLLKSSRLLRLDTFEGGFAN